MSNFKKNQEQINAIHPFRIGMALLIVIFGWTLAGCGGGGGGSGSSTVQGVFIDSAVQGLNYSTPTHTGLTDNNGQFVCEPGEMVQFMIGDLVLGQTTANSVVTPINLVDPSQLSMGFDDPMLVNMGRFLQSLDADGNPENGITITADVRNEVSGRMINFNQSVQDFGNDPNVTALFATLNGLNMPHNGMMWGLIDTQTARQHMIDHMSGYMTNYMSTHMGSGSTNNNSAGNSANGNMGNQMNTNMGSGSTTMSGQTGQPTTGTTGNTANTHMGSSTSSSGSSGISAVQGVFIDSVVQGLNYSTPTHTGLTDENGQFVCEPGEMVQFMIGDLMIGQTLENNVVTPINLVDPSQMSMGFDDPMLINMGRFLQSLDADGNPENGITITADVRNEVSGRMINFNQSMQDFGNDPNVTALFDTLNALNIPHNGMMWGLIDTQTARQHMIDHMSGYMTNYMSTHMGSGSTNNNSAGNSVNGNMGNQMDTNMGSGSTIMSGQTGQPTTGTMGNTSNTIMGGGSMGM